MKNTIKKSLSLLLACLLVMSISVISVAAETDAVAITIASVEAEAGAQVTVPVSIGADSGVASGSFAIDYDSSVLEFVEATDGDIDLMLSEVGVTSDNVNQIGVAFVGADLEAVPAEGGVLFNLVFNVAEGVASQTSALAFNFEAVRETDEPGLFDVDSAAVEYSIENGGVVIAGAGEYVPATVTLAEVSGLPGETVNVPLTITADSYVVSGAFTVEYDGAALDFAGYTDGELAGITQLEVADTADGEAAVGVIFSTEDAASAIVAGGTIATLQFTIAETATAGDYELAFNLVRPDDELTQGGVATADALDTDAEFVDGVVTVEEVVTSTDVTFVVSPENATIEFNGETQEAIEGYATFEAVAFGEKAYKVSAEGYITAEGTVEVAEDMAEVEVTLEEVPAPTSTNVTFNVTPADAAVTLNGVTVNAVDGVAVFEDVEFGTYTYSVAKEGYVTVTAEVTVAEGMAAVAVALEEEAVEPDTAPVPTLQGLRTYSLSYDEETQTITGTSLDTNANAGVAIVIDGATSNSQYTTDSGNGISNTTSGGYKYFMPKKANGLNQTFNIYYTDAEGTKYTYVVNFSFVEDPSVVKFDDILSLRVGNVAYTSSNKRITATVDNATWYTPSSSHGLALYSADSDVTITYAYNAESSSTDGTSTKISNSSTDKYTSYNTGVNTESAGGGAYGKVPMKIFTRTMGSKAVIDVTLTKGEYSTTYQFYILLRDIAYEGDVNVKSVLPLRSDAESFVIDNEAKTIYYEASTNDSSAGFAVETEVGIKTKMERPRRQITAVAGYGLAHGEIYTGRDNNNETANTYDRYLVARLSKGTEQEFKVKIHGGEDGLAYTIYTVTVKFNRVYEGDIEFAEMLTKNADTYEFDTDTNTINVTYSADNVQVAPVLIAGTKIAVEMEEGSVITSSIDGVKSYAVKASNGANQTMYITLRVNNAGGGWDTTVYTVNFNYVG